MSPIAGNSIIPLFTAIPLAGAFLLSLIGRKAKAFGDLISAGVTAFLCYLSVDSVFAVKAAGTLSYKLGGWAPPLGIFLVLDNLTAFMLVAVNIVAFLVSLYSINYMEKFTAKWKFYSLFMLMLAGTNGVLITGDIFNLYVFLEIAAVASYALVAFGTEHEELEASFKYAVMGSLASSFILLGIALLYSYTSTLNMADISAVLAQKAGGTRLISFVSVLFLAGFGLKAALVPFHWWLPDAHPSAPAPISAMLSGVLIKAMGVYAFIRIFFNVFGLKPQVSGVLISLGVLSMISGAFLAIGQVDIKRMLAYSSVSQIGFVVMAVGLATPMALSGGLLHLFNHAMFKSLLFLNAGAIEYSAGTRDLRQMGGLGQRMPVTGATSLLASVSISGIPPFAGFWSKLLIIFACVEAQRTGLALVAVIVSVITLAYYLKLQKLAFFGKLQERFNGIKEVPVLMKIAMIALALICVFGGLILLPEIEWFVKDAAGILASGKEYAGIIK